MLAQHMQRAGTKILRADANPAMAQHGIERAVEHGDNRTGIGVAQRLARQHADFGDGRHGKPGATLRGRHKGRYDARNTHARFHQDKPTRALLEDK